MIVQMTSEPAVQHTASMPQAEIKWSRGRRIVVALASATASWGVVVGAGYLLIQMF